MGQSLQFPGQRGVHKAPQRVYVVSPAGVVKTIYLERNISSPLISSTPELRQGRIVALHDVRINHIYAAQGWSMLADLYAAEKRQTDYETYLLWQENLRSNPFTPDLPTEYLPDEVLRRRQEFSKEQAAKAALPPPQRSVPVAKPAKKVRPR